jgi:Domain of unknown function (DUF4279)
MQEQQASLRRYRIILLIRHPDIDAESISRELKLSPYAAYTAGRERMLPNGNTLPGLATQSSWNHIYHYSGEARLEDSIAEIITFLEGHGAFLRRLSLQGGTIELYIQLPGDVNVGGSVPWELLRKMSDLRISLGAEVFPKFP